MDEITAQIEEINSRLDDNDTAQQDFSDNLDSQFTDLQATIDEQSSTISDLSNSSGQLTFPLTQDTIDLIDEVIKNYLTTSLLLSGVVTTNGSGAATITDANIKSTSVIVVMPQNIGGGTYTAACYAGYALIASTSVNYQSCPFNYLITP